MKVHICVPSRDSVLVRNLAVQLAPKGQSWLKSQLREYADDQGLYIIHQEGEVLYVGKTDGPTMTFGARLRREFQATASKGRHIYPKLEKLSTPPGILVSFITLPEVRELVYSEEVALDDFAKIAVLEQTLVQVYNPKFQERKRRNQEEPSLEKGGLRCKQTKYVSML